METSSSIILIVYILILFVVGYVSKKKIQKVDDYILGGRKLPWLLIAASIAANDIGSGASIGVIQSAANSDGLSAVWYVWLMIPAYLIGILVAPAMRKTGVKTVPDFFGHKYGPLAQRISAFFMIIPNLGVIAINFTASASIIHLLLGVSFNKALVLSLFVASLYSYFGGIVADVYNDTIQLIVLLIGVCVTAGYIFVNTRFSFTFNSFDLVGNFSFSKGFSILLVYASSFVMGLASTTRIYSSKTPKNIKKSILILIPLYLIYALVPVYIGAFLSNQHYQVFNTAVSVIECLYMQLPGFIFVLISLGIIAASLSTVDTLLVGCSTLLVNDVIKPKHRNEKRQLLILRLLVLGFSVCGFIIAIIGIDDIITTLIFLLSLQTSALLIPFIYGHFCKKKILEKHCLLSILVSSLIFLFTSYCQFSYYFINPFLLSVFGGWLCLTILIHINHNSVDQNK